MLKHRSMTLLSLALALPLALAATELVDRGYRYLDAGNAAHARFVFNQALAEDPCDASAIKGLAAAGGDVRAMRARCAPARPTPEEIPVMESGAATPAAGKSADNAPMEYPDADHRPASLRGQAVPKARHGMTVKVGGAEAAPAQAEEPGANEVGSQDRHRAAVPAAAKASKRPGWAGLVDLLLLVVLAALVVWRGAPWFKRLNLKLPAFTFKRPRRDAADTPTVDAAPETPASQDAAPLQAAISQPPPIPVAVEAPVALPPLPLPTPPLAPTPEPASVPPLSSQPWSSPLTPGEAVVASVAGGRVQAGLTAHQFFFSGPRGFKDGWFSREEQLSLAVPLHQVTGLAWSQSKGERLIVGTTLTGDIVLEARVLGALQLRQFAQALSQALEQPLA